MPRGFAVCQLGARMHYAVPRLLQRAGLLARFFTDICAQSGWPRALALFPRGWQPAAVRRLTGRVVPEVPAKKITAFTNFGLEYSRRRSASKNADEMDAAYLWGGQKFCELIIASGFESASGVYVFNTAGRELLQHARGRGLPTVLEQTIAPREREMALLRREHDAHPGWEPALPDGANAHLLAQRERDEWHSAQLILCGSEFVREQIAAAGGPAERCAIVPYGVDGTWENPAHEPHRGALRVLTVGAVGLRKGSPYVLAAAQALRDRAEFRMVGATPISSAAQRELSAHVDLRGAVPRQEIAEHFAWADVFLLPSVCEGSATATYEALAAGLPVIATPNAGSVVRDGMDGFIIPCGDSETIAERIALLANDSRLLNTMSQSARARSRDYTLENYGGRLLAALAPSASR